jgi:molybdopterin synthase sulfur carrier subunit
MTGPAPTSTLRYWAAARAAAGTATDEVAAGSLHSALVEAVARHGSALKKVLSVCSYVVDGDPVGSRAHEDVALAPGALVDVLPPFAGG